MGPVDVEDPVKLLGHGQTEFKSYFCGKDAEGVVADRTIYPVRFMFYFAICD